MKKFILPLLLLLAIGMLAAVESPASDVIGYFKIAPETGITPGSWTPFSIPFAYSSLAINDVVGTAFGDNDYMEDLASGDNAYYFDPEWSGSLTDMNYGAAYWLVRDAANPATTFYLLGTVDPQSIDFTIAGNGAWTPFALNECKDVPLNGPVAGFLFPDASDGDYIEDLMTGDNAYCWLPDGWDGSLTAIQPTHVYWYVSAAGSGEMLWTYDPADPYGSAKVRYNNVRKINTQNRK
jgi:hypothetical protein